MEVESSSDPELFHNLKLHDPIWFPPNPWELIRSESGHVSTPPPPPHQRSLYNPSALSEASLVRLALNALYGYESALVSILKLSAAFCSETADRSAHRISSLWSRSLSSNALGKLLKNVGSSGSIVFLLREFVSYFTSLGLDGNAYGVTLVKSGVAVGEMECRVKGLVNQAFGGAVEKVLEGYVCALDTLCASVALRHQQKSATPSSGVGCVMDVVHSDVTLLELYLHTQELMTHIHVIGNICNLHHVASSFLEFSPQHVVGKAKSEYSNFPRGAELLTYLYNQLQVADPPQSVVLKFLFIRSVEPYYGFIRSWIFKAEISDPYKEFVVEGVSSAGEGGISFDFPVVKERNATSLPCFLKEYLVVLIRAGQQLEVIKKLLELCSSVATGDHKYEDILPCWSNFSDASPLSFSKQNIKELVLARENFYKIMWQKLDNRFTKLQYRYQQVVPRGMSPSGDNRTSTISDIFPLDGLSNPFIPLVSKRDSNATCDIVVSEASSAEEDFSDVVDPLESSECSSSISCEEQAEPEQLIEPSDSLISLEEKYFSALRFSGSMYVDTSLQKPIEAEKSVFVKSSSQHIGDETYPLSHFPFFCFKPEIPSTVTISDGLKGSDSLVMTGSQFEVDHRDMCWPLGGLLRNPIYVDEGCKNGGMSSDYEYLLGWRNENMGTLKKTIAFCSRTILPPQMLSLQRNLFSRNPVLSKSGFSHFLMKPVKELKDDQKRHISYYDFSSVQNPCELYKESCLGNHEDYSWEEQNCSSAPNSSATSDSHNLLHKRSCSNVVDSIRQSSESLSLPCSCGKMSWGSLRNSSSNAANTHAGDQRQSLMAMFEIPVDFIIDQCLLQEILIQYKYVSKLTIKFLEEGFDLQEHLLALRRYYFMELGDWADLFITSLWKHKWHLTGAEENISEIQGFLELSVQRSSCGIDHYNNRLYVYKRGLGATPITVSAMGVHSLDFIGLGYKVDWPTSIVLTPSALTIYADIFSFLMQVKLGVVALTEIWSSLKDIMHAICQNSQADADKCYMHRINIFMKIRHQISHFVSTLHQYVESQLSHVLWFKFVHSLKHKVKDLMDLESVHMEYLNYALHICFLSEETQPVAILVENILQCALDFRSHIVGGIRESRLSGEDLMEKLSHTNLSQVVDLQAIFNKNLKELHLCYLKSSKHQEFGLSRFWGYLNHNGYYSGGMDNELGTYAFSGQSTL